MEHADGTTARSGAAKAPSGGDTSQAVLLVMGGLALGRLWLLPLGNSFWLDESVIACIVRGSFRSVVTQAFIGAQSVAFCVIEWLVRSVGSSEAVLRLPSVLASIGSLY